MGVGFVVVGVYGDVWWCESWVWGGGFVGCGLGFVWWGLGVGGGT